MSLCNFVIWYFNEKTLRSKEFSVSNEQGSKNEVAWEIFRVTMKVAEMLKFSRKEEGKKEIETEGKRKERKELKERKEEERKEWGMGLYIRKEEESVQEETKVLGLLPGRKNIFLTLSVFVVHLWTHQKIFEQNRNFLELSQNRYRAYFKHADYEYEHDFLKFCL